MNGKNGERAGPEDGGLLLREMECLTQEPEGDGVKSPKGFVCSLSGRDTPSAERLRQTAVRIRALIDSWPDGKIGDLRAVGVAAGELVARSVEGEGMGLGDGLVVAADEGCRVQRCGYLGLEEEGLTVISPVWIDPEEMEAHWLILDGEPQPITEEMVLQELADRGVIKGIDKGAVRRLVRRLREGGETGSLQVARGRMPVSGEDARVEMLIVIERRAGRMREDGSIDFREVNFAPNARQGELLARRIPSLAGEEGMTVKGGRLAAVDGRERRLVAGDNVRVEERDGIELFYATTTGLLREEEDRLSVVRILQIHGDVNFNTGNLDFDGEICVEGTVVQGFSVKASGDITIVGTVEQGAEVRTGGDLSVGQGIVGRRTKVVAQGSVQAQFVQEATVVAGHNIHLGNFAYQAQLRAGGEVQIEPGSGHRAGSLIGGQIWARTRIEAVRAGSQSHVPTLLMAGVDPENVQKLDRLKEKIDLTYGQLMRLLQRFGMGRIDVGQIQNMIAAASGPRRKVLVNRAHQLGQTIQAYKKLVGLRKKLEEKMATQIQDVAILIEKGLFPGVEVRLAEHRRILEREMAGAHFRVVDDELINITEKQEIYLES